MPTTAWRSSSEIDLFVAIEIAAVAGVNGNDKRTAGIEQYACDSLQILEVDLPVTVEVARTLATLIAGSLVRIEYRGGSCQTGLQPRHRRNPPMAEVPLR